MISSILYCNLSYGSTTTFQNKQPAPDLHKLDKLDLNKANWPKIKEELKKIEWKKAVKDLTLEGFNDFLQDNLFMTYVLSTPLLRVIGPQSLPSRETELSLPDVRKNSPPSYSVSNSKRQNPNLYKQFTSRSLS